jgi:hypothetical protein
MITLGVIAGIGNNAAKFDSPGGNCNQLLELIDVWLGSSPTRESEDEMVIRPADDCQLGIVAVSHLFPRVSCAIPTFDEITAGGGRLQPG